MKNDNALEKRFQTISEALSDRETFVADDVAALFPEMRTQTLYWMIAELVKEGYIKRIRRGWYAFNEWRGRRRVSISQAAQDLQILLNETGFYYYISGLDILSKYMLHVPEQYPIILFAEKAAKEEISQILTDNHYWVIEPVKLKRLYEDAVYSGRSEIQVIIYPTDNFEYAAGGLATIEKAFIDTYYAVTRNAYPLALQELVRIYENLVRLGNVDQKRLVTVAGRRSIQYDIRYIVESKYITEGALRFVELMKGQK